MRGKGSTYVLIGLVAVLLLAALVSLNLGGHKGGEGTSADASMPVEGALAPDFQLNTLSGETIKLSQFRGKKLILTFWGLSCPSCRMELPHLDEIAASKEAVVITVVIGDPLSVRAYFQRHPYFRGRMPNFIVALDPRGEVFRAYKIRFTPTNFFINSRGYIVKVAIGALPTEHIKKVITNI